jgi:transposase
MEEAVSQRRCCGIDIHKKIVVVCVLSPEGKQAIHKTYQTYKNELIRMRVWLKQMKVTEVALESTSVYWQPVWNVLEGHFALTLANPQQVKALVGRKSDKKDSRRIAEFLHDGRLDASFVPPQEFRNLRSLTRMRTKLLEQRNVVHNELRDLLETANIKLSSVASDLMGVTGKGILNAMAAGMESAERLSWKARGSLRQKEAEIKEALKGEFSPLFRKLLQLHLDHYEFLTRQVEVLEDSIREHMAPYREQLRLLGTIPGVQEVAAWSLLAELGVDMSVFPTAAHCASWAGLCPGQNVSAGVVKSTRTKKGNRYLRRMLTQSAWAVSHKKEGYLRAFFLRVNSSRGWTKAIVATAHKILVIAYNILKTGQEYRELGGDYFDKLNPGRTAKRLKARLERMGYAVSLQPLHAQSAPASAVDATPPAASQEPSKRKRGRPRKASAVEPISSVLSST